MINVKKQENRQKFEKRRLKVNQEYFWAYIFISPTIICTLIFFIGPVLYSFYMSLTEWNGLSKPSFIGIKNYISLFSDKNIFREFINTLYFTLGIVPASLILSILLAIALNKGLKGTGIYRTIYFLPAVTMPVAIALVWQWLYNSQFGLIDKFLGLINLPQPVWLADPKFIMPAIIIVSIWSSLGYNMIILLSGLQGIPKTFYEAAEIDGAGAFTQFKKITLPLLTPSIFFLLIMSLIGSLKAFDLIYIFAGASNSVAAGGPLLVAVRTMVYGIYEKGFTLLNMGYASTEAVLLFAIIMIITLIQFIFQNRWVYYDN